MNHLALAQQILADNPVMNDKIIKATNISAEQVPEILKETLRFMHLTTVAGERLTPSHIVDLAWHEFILFTRYYSEFCKKHLGKYIHHNPGGDESLNRQCFKKTHYWYQKTFHEAPAQQYWGRVIAEVADEADCGL